MRPYIFISMLFVFLLAGCFPHKENVEVISASPSGYDIYLYTQTDQKQKAESYFNALLDWKMKQGNDGTLAFKKSKTDSNSIEVSENELPALVIKKEGKTVTKISGNSNQKNILSKLEQSVSYHN
ncbi:hypothetical protein MUN89_14750 [Halobacillus salinarum]|uniref:Lipoprotein n=1 Tax=Halobacillus salinarum TaxID=2932257 RepID=A0ABY4EI68_9BACI|nr:hypothetical protein [Halobacillus salinarum]UOQ43187.1 hypothetical protein MUN89_14750 [Halobacillus salinarum]